MLLKNEFGSVFEAVFYPLLLVIVMWLFFWADHLFPMIDFYKLGIMPNDPNSLKGIFLMPLIHSKNEIGHIINNTPPTFILLAAIIYYYRDIALRVFIFSWLLTGLGIWLFAENMNSYHIGMSGVVYAMAGFLFTSGIIRKYKPLQSISLFVAFIYGGMIWGVFPTETHVSWEGHLSGLIVGVLLAFVYKKHGPQAPKYLYEIEKEMGIEPPDFEAELNEKIRIAQELENEKKKQVQEINIVYHYIPQEKKDDTKE